MIAQDDRRIAAYAREFERWAAGSAAQKAELRAELEAHLYGALEAGRLEQAIAGLGPPRDAARIFAEGRPLVPAARSRRVLGALVDFGSVVALIAVAVALSTLIAGRPSWCAEAGAATVGIYLEVAGDGGCTDVGLWGGIVLGMFVLGSVFWFCVGLTVMEWRYGQTPGKALLGLRVVSEDGTAISAGQAAVRRLPLVFSGGLQVIDWAFALRGPRYQRGFDRIARTLVINGR